jgi:hypothetical protein
MGGTALSPRPHPEQRLAFPRATSLCSNVVVAVVPGDPSRRRQLARRASFSVRKLSHKTTTQREEGEEEEEVKCAKRRENKSNQVCRRQCTAWTTAGSR